jgi:hypothetical protein
MTPKGRLTLIAEKRRDQIEEEMAVLARSLRDIDEILLRMQQAIRRSSIVYDVLGPAVERLLALRSSLRSAQDVIGLIWKEEQTRHWSEVENEQDHGGIR